MLIATVNVLVAAARGMAMLVNVGMLVSMGVLVAVHKFAMLVFVSVGVAVAVTVLVSMFGAHLRTPLPVHPYDITTQ